MNSLHKNRIKTLREAYDNGLSLRAAAAHCGIAKATVERYWRRWKSNDFGGEMVCRVTGATKRIWAQEAERREMSVHELHSLVLDTMAEDNLFNAVIE